MRPLACVVVVFATLSIQVIAAEVPNVVGTWMIVSKKLSTDGDSSRELLADRASLSIKIVRQDGAAFSGTIVGPKRKKERIVGSFRRDGKTFVYSSDQTAGAGQFQGNEMQICRTDAGCALLTRTK